MVLGLVGGVRNQGVLGLLLAHWWVRLVLGLVLLHWWVEPHLRISGFKALGVLELILETASGQGQGPGGPGADAYPLMVRLVPELVPVHWYVGMSPGPCGGLRVS